MYSAKAYAATSATTPLEPATLQRRDPGERDFQIEILFCGVCHSDLHYARNEWSGMPAVFPAVPACFCPATWMHYSHRFYFS